MILGDNFKSGNSKTVLGIEFTDKQAIFAYGEIGRNVKIRVLYCQNYPENIKNLGEVLLWAEQLIREQKWNFQFLAVASERIVLKTLPLRSISSQETEQIIRNEMEVSWGFDPQNYCFRSLRYNSQSPELQIGLLTKDEFQGYGELAKNLSAELISVTLVRKIQFGETIFFSQGFANEREQMAAEQFYAGAVYSLLVGAGLKKDFNFVLRENSGSTLNILAAPACRYGALLCCFLFLGSLFFYGFSCWKLYQMRQQLIVLNEWEKRLEECTNLTRKISHLKSDYQFLQKQYGFRIVQVNKILDALPEYNAEIRILKSFNAVDKSARGGLELNGTMENMQDLREFVKKLKLLSSFKQAQLLNGKTGEGGRVEYSIRLSYGVGEENKK